MNIKSIRFAAVVLSTILAAPASFAFPACDSFGQDWNINLGAFGGAFPGALVISGCRDCNQSLGCGATLALDGAATITQGAGGAAFTTMWSMTAFRPGSGSCVSTHWNGSLRAGALSLAGTVSNEFGPFGAMTITLGSACGASAVSGADPANSAVSRWSASPADASGGGFIVP